MLTWQHEGRGSEIGCIQLTTSDGSRLIASGTETTPAIMLSRAMLTIQLCAVAGLVIPQGVVSVRRPVARCAAPRADVGSAAEIAQAALAVKKVAARFGVTQRKAAEAWVEAAVGEGCPTTSLLEEQLQLFNECLLEDEGNKCKELDAALTEFDKALVSSPKSQQNKLNLDFIFGSQRERSAARVKDAARAFGNVEAQAAKEWTEKLLKEGKPDDDSPSLMEQQVLIFGECKLTPDGKPDPKCLALYEALDALQIALTGEVMQPTEAIAKTLTKTGFEGGQGGQFKSSAPKTNNGCWPYA